VVLVDDRHRVRVGGMRRHDGLPGSIVDGLRDEADGRFVRDADRDLGRWHGTRRRAN
jgi:hypothetical protein